MTAHNGSIRSHRARPLAAVIMAAGAARRLGAWGERHPKCLLSFDGRTLLARHLEYLALVGVTNVTVITGFLAEQVEAAGPCASTLPLRFIRNEHQTTGNLLSMRLGLLTHTSPDHDLLMMDADVLYEPSLLGLLASANETCMLVDPTSDSTGEEMMVGMRDGRAHRIGRGADPTWPTHGEAVGFTRLAADDVPRILAAATELIAAGQQHAECESALDLFLRQRPAAVRSVAGLAWLEIDFPSDVEQANCDVLPLVRAREALFRRSCPSTPVR